METGCLTLFISEAILTEVHDVLSRPKIRTKNPAITDETVESLLTRIRKVAQRIDPVPISFSLPRDPDDEPYLNLAIAAGANCLVTRDRDMLDLMHDSAFQRDTLLSGFSTPWPCSNSSIFPQKPHEYKYCSCSHGHRRPVRLG